ncbi:L-fucose isomerase, first N-terminal domain [Amycolatopsis pretoriensis]|uniref:FucIase n=1 Tax=Amycolatopsis pretoriensis TaxID=218821 RepID=A0A1H5QLW0_9PSEU|nr:hypothetical protein [Amycolatopsis pretoriensis]SEF26338.1 L-fucose isomerase, first N-terminal domain [Amycolatopsis pretoriensis]
MARIGVLSPSNGRDYVHSGIAGFVRENEDRLVAALVAEGHDVVRASAPISAGTLATSSERELEAAGVDLTVLHYCVWAFPHFTMLAAGALTGPLVLVATLDPVQPGMVGMLAAGGALDQIGRRHTRLWGAPPDVVAPIGVLARAADGHEHGRRQHGPVATRVRHRRRGDRPVGGRLAGGSGRPGGEARGAGVAGAADRRVPRDAFTDFGGEPGLHRHQRGSPS